MSASYVRELAGHGLKPMAADALVRLRDHGVSASYVGELKALGYTDLSTEEIVRLRIHDVRPDFIRRANQPGRRSPEELVRLRIGG